eukprot:9680710-Heterocapsa_arctica.AAC.1
MPVRPSCLSRNPCLLADIPPSSGPPTSVPVGAASPGCVRFHRMVTFWFLPNRAAPVSLMMSVWR